MSKTYYLFISHSWSYADAYEKLINLLEKRPYFPYVDYSIPRYDPVHCASDRELNQAIYNKMRPCHIVLIMAGVYATYSKWINKEIRIAKESFAYAKPILAIKPWGNINASVVVAQSADRMVGWNTESVVSAIREIAL
jgi:hypothetical protein